MTISGRKTTREEFARAVISAQNVTTKFYPRTRFALYCEEFLEANKNAIKDHESEDNKRTKALRKELRDFMIDNAVEKDGVMLYDEKGNCKYGRDGEKRVGEKKEEIETKIEEIRQEFLKEEIIVKTIKDALPLPENCDYYVEKHLNGFAFKNKIEFSEEVILEPEEHTTD